MNTNNEFLTPDEESLLNQISEKYSRSKSIVDLHQAVAFKIASTAFDNSSAKRGLWGYISSPGGLSIIMIALMTPLLVWISSSIISNDGLPEEKVNYPANVVNNSAVNNKTYKSEGTTTIAQANNEDNNIKNNRNIDISTSASSELQSKKTNTVEKELVSNIKKDEVSVTTSVKLPDNVDLSELKQLLIKSLNELGLQIQSTDEDTQKLVVTTDRFIARHNSENSNVEFQITFSVTVGNPSKMNIALNYVPVQSQTNLANDVENVFYNQLNHKIVGIYKSLSKNDNKN